MYPPSTSPVYVAVGKLRRPHGVHGEIIMDVYTDFPERLRPGMQLYAGEVHQPLKLTHRRWHQNSLLVTFEGYDTPESVGELRNMILYLPIDTLPDLPAGEYYHHQLLGLQVIDETGKLLGQVSEILETGANDVLVVQPETGREFLLPFIDSVLLDVNLPAGQIRVHLLPGILDEAGK
jgi:16S rRNA processing protein RimM